MSIYWTLVSQCLLCRLCTKNICMYICISATFLQRTIIIHQCDKHTERQTLCHQRPSDTNACHTHHCAMQMRRAVKHILRCTNVRRSRRIEIPYLYTMEFHENLSIEYLPQKFHGRFSMEFHVGKNIWKLHGKSTRNSTRNTPLNNRGTWRLEFWDLYSAGSPNVLTYDMTSAWNLVILCSQWTDDVRLCTVDWQLNHARVSSCSGHVSTHLPTVCHLGRRNWHSGHRYEQHNQARWWIPKLRWALESVLPTFGEWQHCTVLVPQWWCSIDQRTFQNSRPG